MKFRIIMVFVILVASLSLVSCVTSHDFNVDITCDEFAENNHGMNNFQAEIGDKIRVKLCSNPTTGFQWEYEMTGDKVLQEEDYDFEEPEGDDIVGAGGKETWTFEAIEKGTTEVRMEYSRPWEGGEQAEWTYTFTVTVE